MMPLYISFLKITPYGYGLIGIIIFSILLATAIFRRLKTKIGCLSFVYVSLVVFCISIFTFFITSALISYTFTKIETIAFGEKHTAHIVDYKTSEGADDEGNTTYSHYPIVEFTTNDGKKIIRTLDESSASGAPVIGSSQNIHYYAEKDRTTSIGTTSFIAFFGLLIMGVVLGFAFVGIIRFALGYSMDKFYTICKNVGLKVFIPFMMIAFDALLIYAFFYGNTEAIWVKVLLIFFIIMLTLATFGYIKMIITKTLNFHQTSAGSWEGDWE